jgi:hypothetical protein
MTSGSHPATSPPLQAAKGMKNRYSLGILENPKIPNESKSERLLRHSNKTIK